LSGRWTWVAASLLAAFAACAAAGLLLAGGNNSFQHEESLTDTIGLLLAFTVFIGVGALPVPVLAGWYASWT
jgi:cytochrome bd-type quinol oxidase subunit 2